MLVAYVTTYDSTDVSHWSGLGFYIANCLQEAGCSLQRIGSLRQRFRNSLAARQRLYRLVGRNFPPDREATVLRGYADQVEHALQQCPGCQIVFCPGTTPIAQLETRLPIVFWADSNFEASLDFYSARKHLTRKYVRDGNAMEQAALSRCAAAIYSSDWAAETACRNYHVDPRKVHVVPFGANLPSTRSQRDIETLLARRPSDSCRLLLVGVDWVRKGADKAVQIAGLLNQMGLPTELHIVGCTPPRPMPGFVVCHGFISKRSEEGRRALEALFKEAHFFILPSIAECYGVVFCEAHSFGVPSLATRVGGIPTAVLDGTAGLLFDLSTEPRVYAEVVLRLMRSRPDYHRFAIQAFRDYETRTNWAVAGRRVKSILETVCSDWPPGSGSRSAASGGIP